jgi:hypothetical protein
MFLCIYSIPSGRGPHLSRTARERKFMKSRPSLIDYLLHSRKNIYRWTVVRLTTLNRLCYDIYLGGTNLEDSLLSIVSRMEG